jgi:hypothetical protein
VGSSSSAKASAARISRFTLYVPGCSDAARVSSFAASTKAPAVSTTPASSSARPIAEPESPGWITTSTEPEPGPS